MERLTAQDLSMLWPDEIGWPQDIGALAIIDGRCALGTDGHVRIDAVQKAIASRLHLVPRFRQILHRPRAGLGWPLWVDAQAFDLSDHVGVFLLSAPAGEAQLLRAVEQLRRRPLDRSRPLWEMWFLPGLTGGRIAAFIKAHHAIADGVAGVATLGALLDSSPTAPAAQPRPWSPAPPPSAGALLQDNLRRRLAALGHTFSLVGRPVSVVRGVRNGWPAVHETMAEKRAPRTTFNRPLAQGRRFALVRSTIDLAKQIAHAHGATINDVLVAAVAGGLGDFFRARGEPTDDVVLRAYVPVSLHRERSGPAQGNRDGLMVIPLPIGVPDPVQRLRLIAMETAERRKRSRPPAGTLLRNGVVQRAFLRVMAHQRWANVYIANVPGPPSTLYLAGSPLLEVFPIVPLIGNVTLGVGALSYAGQFNIAVVADHDACPEIDVVANGVRRSLDSLAGSLQVNTTPGGA